MSKCPRLILLTSIAVVLNAEVSYAYAGPGSIISGIGTLLAVVAAIVAAIFGFFWFPLKRLLHKIRGGDTERDVAQPKR